MRILLLLVLPLLLMGAAAANPAEPGALAPDALGLGRDQQPLALSQYRGRVVVLSFWASWCAPCIAEMTMLENLQKAVGQDQLAVLGVNWRESHRDFQRLLQQLQDVQLTLSSDADGAVGARYGVTAIPQLFVIDQHGRIAYRHSGYDPQTIVTALLSEITGLLQAEDNAAGGVRAKMANEPASPQR